MYRKNNTFTSSNKSISTSSTFAYQRLKSYSKSKQISQNSANIENQYFQADKKLYQLNKLEQLVKRQGYIVKHYQQWLGNVKSKIKNTYQQIQQNFLISLKNIQAKTIDNVQSFYISLLKRINHIKFQATQFYKFRKIHMENALNRDCKKLSHSKQRFKNNHNTQFTSQTSIKQYQMQNIQKITIKQANNIYEKNQKIFNKLYKQCLEILNYQQNTYNKSQAIMNLAKNHSYIINSCINQLIKDKLLINKNDYY